MRLIIVLIIIIHIAKANHHPNNYNNYKQNFNNNYISSSSYNNNYDNNNQYISNTHTQHNTNNNQIDTGNNNDNNNQEENIESTQLGMVLGKDRVLLQFNLDLKWLYLLIINKQKWLQLRDNILSFFTNIYETIDQKKRYNKDILNILSDIRFRNDKCLLKVYNIPSLVECINYAYNKPKLILLYIEDNYSSMPSQYASLFRRCLSHTKLSEYINDNYILTIATVYSHSIYKKLYQQYSKLAKFPILLVIEPYDIYSTTTTTAGTGDMASGSMSSTVSFLNIFGQTRPKALDYAQLEGSVVGVLAVPAVDMRSDHMYQFLHS